METRSTYRVNGKEYSRFEDIPLEIRNQLSRPGEAAYDLSAHFGTVSYEVGGITYSDYADIPEVELRGPVNKIHSFEAPEGGAWIGLAETDKVIEVNEEADTEQSEMRPRAAPPQRSVIGMNASTQWVIFFLLVVLVVLITFSLV